MLTTLLSTALCIVFLLLGGIHFYWVMGGRWGFKNALPTNKNGERILNPKTRDSAIVGLGLLAFAGFYLLKTEWIEWYVPEWINTYGQWIIPSIFLLRAIGDFRYVGFFKRVVGTDFGKLDTKFFSPLCLAIATIGYLIAFL